MRDKDEVMVTKTFSQIKGRGFKVSLGSRWEIYLWQNWIIKALLVSGIPSDLL